MSTRLGVAGRAGSDITERRMNSGGLLSIRSDSGGRSDGLLLTRSNTSGTVRRAGTTSNSAAFTARAGPGLGFFDSSEDLSAFD